MPASHIVAIKNGINFRDLGGIQTKDGRKIRSGLLFRSGDFAAITPVEQDFLANELGVKHVLDYRDKNEAQTRPDNLWQQANYLNIPANPLNEEVTANLAQELINADTLKKHSPADFMIQLYQLLPFNNPAYQTLTELLLNQHGQSIVQHCAIGKDRTGVGVALTLFALGVDEQTVIEDYTLSDKLLAPLRDEIFARYQGHLTAEELAKRKQIFAADPIYLQAAIDAIKARYQSIDDWLENEYQLTEKKRQIIQNYYLI